MKRKYCTACKIEEATASVAKDKGPSFELCATCRYRLINFALRPLEYFNLAAIHGEYSFLHYEFYDSDSGEALDPMIEVVDAQDFPLPTLDQVKHDVERTIDYAVVHFVITDDVYDCLQQLDKTKILKSISARLRKNKYLRRKLLKIVAHGVGTFAAPWLRQQMKKQRKPDYYNFGEAICKCLPFEEAFALLTSVIEEENTRAYRHQLMSIIYFERVEILDWIETMQHRIKDDIDITWGDMAAASQLDWPRAKQWLERGTPLAMVAIMALMCYTDQLFEDPMQYFRGQPSFPNPDKIEVMAHTINNFSKTLDDGAELKSCCQSVINSLFGIDFREADED